MEELYKRQMVTGSGITRRQDLKKQKPRNTVWRF